MSNRVFSGTGADFGRFRYLVGALAVCLVPALTGCLATQLAGDIARSDDKSIDFTFAPGVDADRLSSVNGIGVQLRPISGSGQYAVSMGQGTTSTGVYSDMLVQELLQLGFNSHTVSPEQKEADFPALRSRGIDIVLVGNLNLSMTSSTMGLVTGGDYMNTGVSGFTLKALDAGTQDLLFIVSAEYGKSQDAGDVAEDIGQVLQDALKNPATAAGGTSRAPADAADREASAAQAVGHGSSAEAVQPLKERGADLLWVQMTLNEHGFECGKPDGIMGPKTRGCIKEFQRARDLPPTGKLDTETSQELRSLR